MAIRVNGGSYPALTRALGIRGSTTLDLRPMAGNMQYSPATAGQLAFANTPYSAYEGNALSFSVSRNLGASGTVAVDWSMTVSEGAPTPSNGTISWNNGEAGVKTVQVTAGLVGADRTGTITLSNPRAVGGGTAPTISGATQSFTILNDASQPSQPTLGTPTNVTSSSLIVPVAFSSTDAQSGIQDHALEQAQGVGSTTFSQIAQGAAIFPRTVTGLSPSTTYRYRARGRNRAGVYSIYSAIVEAITDAAAGNDGFIGSYANINLATHPIYSIDMDLADYHLFATGAAPFVVTSNGGLTGTGSHSHNVGGWWDGRGFCRIFPPTSDQYERSVHVGNNLHRSGTLGIQEATIRFEMRYGPTIASAFQTQGNGCKHSLIQFGPTPGGSSGAAGRVVFFIAPSTFADSPTNRRNNTMAMAPAVNTLAAYGESVYNDEDVFNGGTNTYYCNGPQGFYLIDASDSATTFLGKPLFRCGDFLTVEYRFITTSTAQYPRGLIAMRYTNRAGISVERGIPWDYKSQFAMNQYLEAFTQIGTGQFNFALPPGAGTYFDLGGMITVARNYGGWLNPRTGFVQV